jgi:hypothetical protein
MAHRCAERRLTITYHIRSDSKGLNHLFDNDICACTGKRQGTYNRAFQFVTVGKLDVEKITCEKCKGKVSEFVFRELTKAMGEANAAHKSQRRKRSNRR